MFNALEMSDAFGLQLEFKFDLNSLTMLPGTEFSQEVHAVNNWHG